MSDTQTAPLKVIIGLGNPGPRFAYHRHNIGFMVVDELAQRHGGQWRGHDTVEHCSITINDRSVILVKPQTFMNESGRIGAWLKNHGLKTENMLVIHDELELPFGRVAIKHGGSAKGHNGVRSLIEHVGDAFARVRCGVDRPKERTQVADYVLGNFTEGEPQVQQLIAAAVGTIEQLFV